MDFLPSIESAFWLVAIIKTLVKLKVKAILTRLSKQQWGAQAKNFYPGKAPYLRLLSLLKAFKNLSKRIFYKGDKF